MDAKTLLRTRKKHALGHPRQDGVDVPRLMPLPVARSVSQIMSRASNAEPSPTQASHGADPNARWMIGVRPTTDTSVNMEGNLFDALRASLRDEPSSLDEVARTLSAILPIAAARGTPWLERELGRAPFATSPRRSPVGQTTGNDDELTLGDENGAGPAGYLTAPDDRNGGRSRPRNQRGHSGLAKHEIIEIGACLVENGAVSESSARSSSVAVPSPPRSSSSQALAMTISSAMADQRETRLSDLLAFVGSIPWLHTTASLTTSSSSTPRVRGWACPGRRVFGWIFSSSRTSYSPVPAKRRCRTSTELSRPRTDHSARSSARWAWNASDGLAEHSTTPRRRFASCTRCSS